MKASWIAYLATWFGAGYAPKMSGTFGSIAAIAPAYFLREYLGAYVLFALSWVCFVIGVWATQKYLCEIGDSKADPKEVVIDEVAGLWLTLACLPHDMFGYLLGFLLFRLYDITKPPPIGLIDKRCKGAFGVMIDDMLAGLFAIVTFWLLETII
jgi:phosphatidylglycerophosphatase A